MHVEGYDLTDAYEVYTHGEKVWKKVTPKSAVFCPDECPKCGYQPGWRYPFRYIEPLLYDKELMVVGWCDGIIDWSEEGEEDEIWDLKTKASSDSMDWIEDAPDEGNASQLMWYLDMAKIKHGRIVYLDRASKYLVDAFVEHQIEFDAVMMEKEKEKVRVFREVLKDSKSSVPSCPDGGDTRFGPCECRGLEDAWKSFGT